MIKSEQLDSATLNILSTKGELNHWDLIRAVGYELNVRLPTYNPLFRARHALHMRRLEKKGEVAPRRETENIAGVDIAVVYYKRPAPSFGRQ